MLHIIIKVVYCRYFLSSPKVHDSLVRCIILKATIPYSMKNIEWRNSENFHNLKKNKYFSSQIQYKVHWTCSDNNGFVWQQKFHSYFQTTMGYRRVHLNTEHRQSIQHLFIYFHAINIWLLLIQEIHWNGPRTPRMTVFAIVSTYILFIIRIDSYFVLGMFIGYWCVLEIEIRFFSFLENSSEHIDNDTFEWCLTFICATVFVQ